MGRLGGETDNIIMDSDQMLELPELDKKAIECVDLNGKRKLHIRKYH